jgi:glycerol-3-phosphate acyltransferase PlsY
LPFAVWIGRLALRRNIQEYGDKNPGATNVLRAGSKVWFVVAVIADISKAAVPIGLAYQIAGIRGWPMWAIAIAPTLGHIFSPFLGWRGGKALATVFGAMIGLTLYELPLVVLPTVIILSALLTVTGWAVMLTMAVLLAYLFLFHPDPLLLTTMATLWLLLAYTHRTDLHRRPSFRPLKRP